MEDKVNGTALPSGGNLTSLDTLGRGMGGWGWVDGGRGRGILRGAGGDLVLFEGSGNCLVRLRLIY